MGKRPAFILSLLFVMLFINEIFNIFSVKGYTREQLDKLAVVVHRAGKDVFENTLSGIRKCVADGVAEIEIDVRMTADGMLVLCHDETIERVTDGHGRVCEMTLNDIQQYSVKGSSSESLPTLGDALEVINGKCRLLIDVKSDADAEKLAKAVINEVALYQAFGWVSVQSFDDAVLAELHRLGHPFPLEKIFLFKFPGLPFIIDNGLSYFDFNKYDYISSFNIYHKTLTPALVDNIHKKGKTVKMWAPDAPQKTRKLPVDGVITANPELWK